MFAFAVMPSGAQKPNSPPKKKKAFLSASPGPLAAGALRVPSPTALGAPATGS